MVQEAYNVAKCLKAQSSESLADRQITLNICICKTRSPRMRLHHVLPDTMPQEGHIISLAFLSNMQNLKSNWEETSEKLSLKDIAKQLSCAPWSSQGHKR